MADRRNKNLVALIIVVVALALGIGIIAIGRLAGTQPATTPAPTLGTSLRTGQAPVRNRSRAPRIRLTDGRTGRPFDSATLRGEPYAVLFLSTRCGAIGGAIREALAGAPRGSSPAILGISADPAADTPARVRAWIRRNHEPPGFHYLIGSAAQLRPYWSAWGLTPPPASEAASVCSGVVPVHLVGTTGLNAGQIDVEAQAPGSALGEVLGAAAR